VPVAQKPRLSEESASIALARSDGLCVCGCGRRATEWHHIWQQQRFPELVDNPDAVVAVASPCHSAHTSAAKRFPRSICRHAEVTLTMTPQMAAYLDRYYPDDGRLL
jgi:hypothetical protein